MILSKYLKPENIFLDIACANKRDILLKVADAAVKSRIVSNRGAIFSGLVERENTMSTGVGERLAFPHATSDETDVPGIIFIRLIEPVDFDSLDNRLVDIILALIFPAIDPNSHVRLLARVARLCKQEDFVSTARQATDAETLLKAIRGLEDPGAFS
ncbi:MAG: PTS sugar transporter subunit IIA [Deltaproteobacteria bacterium]|nr:PTS sugar transporter subunit IIA [Deltaproteobacteria bacterium]